MDQYIGKLLDNRYELLERIGTGGMAVVYRALCHRLNRQVAVKILKPELAEDKEFRRRFHDESQAVAMLSHPNIVSVYDVSRSDHLDYIVMELIDGITLKQYMLKRGTPLNWREALHFIIQIVKALGHAHSRGIIHRDIKPHNIMVLRDGSVKVADFGIARLASSAQSTLTQEALGSVHYISPEQAKGSHIDGRSDIYSAGVVLYEMVTGRLPYEGENAVAVAIQHINSIPIPPQELNPDLPEALQEIILKAMAPNADQRYASADEMLADLEEFRKNPSISFEYTPAELRDCETEDEPTQVVSSAHIRAESEDSIRRRQGEEGPRRRPSEDSIRRRQGGEGVRRRPSEDSVRRRQGEERVRRRPGEDSVRRRQDEAVRRRWEEDAEEEPPRRGIPAALIAVVVILIFVAGIVWFLWESFFGPLFKPADTFEVPSLVNMTMEEIYARTDITDVWQIVVSESYIATDQYEYGHVAQQVPAAKTTVRENNLTITVYLSSGPDDGEIRMPTVIGKEVRVARDELNNLGLSLEVTEMKANSDIINENYVISTDPEPGAILEEGQAVTIVVSIGPKVEMATVPTLTNMTLEEALEKLTANKLSNGGVTEVADDTVQAGYVVRQSIPAATEVPAGTGISLQVSTGPARPVESEDPTPPPTTDPTAPPTTDPTAPPTTEPTEPPVDPTTPPTTEPTPPNDPSIPVVDPDLQTSMNPWIPPVNY